MLKPFYFIIVAVFFNTQLFAEDLSKFHQYFELVKNEQGDVSYVKMKFSNSTVNVVPYLNQVKSDLIAEIKRLQNKSGEQEVESLLASLQESSEKTFELDEDIQTLRNSFNHLRGVDVETLFESAQTQGVLAYFKGELEKALRVLDLSIIASTEDPRYFFKRNVTFEVVKRAMNFAKKRFDSIPVLNILSFVMIEVHNLVLEQRIFHQNMLLHYLENVDETKLGLSRIQADRLFSSIYESKISPVNLKESKLAVQTWDRYGLHKFYAQVRSANTSLRRSIGTFDEIGARLNFAFFVAKENGETVVKNLFNKKHKFSNKMATAYNFDQPNQVRRFRALLNLGKIGLGFLTLPSWLKSQVEGFIDSFYVEQKRLEGALVGYFDINGNQLMSNEIRKGLINPYILY